MDSSGTVSFFSRIRGCIGHWVRVVTGISAGLTTDALYILVGMTSLHGFKVAPSLDKLPLTHLLGTCWITTLNMA